MECRTRAGRHKRQWDRRVYNYLTITTVWWLDKIKPEKRGRHLHIIRPIPAQPINLDTGSLPIKDPESGNKDTEGTILDDPRSGNSKKASIEMRAFLNI